MKNLTGLKLTGLKLVGFLLLLLLVSPLQAAYITDKLVAGLYKDASLKDKPIKALASGTPLEVVSRKNGFVKVRTSDGVIGYVESAYLTDEKPARSILLDTQAKLSILQKKLKQLQKLQSDRNANENSDSNSGNNKAVDITEWQDKLAKAEGQISQLKIQLQAAKLSGGKAQENQELFEREKRKLVEDMQAKADAALRLLQNENDALKKQLAGIADILQIKRVNASAATVEPHSAATAGDTDSSWGTGIKNMLANKAVWITLAVILLLGFVGGYYFMRYRVRQRFGSVFRF